jgi:hypothetical protein
MEILKEQVRFVRSMARASNAGCEKNAENVEQNAEK